MAAVFPWPDGADQAAWGSEMNGYTRPRRRFDWPAFGALVVFFAGVLAVWMVMP